MALSPTRRDRWLALALLLLALALVYLLLIHPLFTRPLQEVDAQVAALQERQQRIALQLRQAPQIAQRLQQAQQQLALQPGFMDEISPELAASALVQRLETAVRQASPGNRSCAISDRSPLPADHSGRFVRVAIQARLRCGNRELIAVLHALESGSPYLELTRLDILAQPAATPPGASGGGLDAAFELAGYLRPQPHGPAAGAVHAP
jgi:general secretion pathway protein M